MFLWIEVKMRNTFDQSKQDEERVKKVTLVSKKIKITEMKNT